MAVHYKPYHLHYLEKKIDLDLDPNLNKSALIIMDVQKAFISGNLSIMHNRANSKLAIDQMIDNINKLIESDVFDYHIYVQDSHKPDYDGFASNHNVLPFDSIEVKINDKCIQKILWPDHCRIDGLDKSNGSGIEFDDRLIVPNVFSNKDAQDQLSIKSFVLSKGDTSEPYSAFKDYYGIDTGLHTDLINRGVKRVYICGLARDFGVWWTAADCTTYKYKSNDSNVFDSNVFDTYVIWDSTLAAPGNTDLVEYDYTQSNSPHHSQIKRAIDFNLYSMVDMTRGLISNDYRSNRWVQSFLTPYGIKTINTEGILNNPILPIREVVQSITTAVGEIVENVVDAVDAVENIDAVKNIDKTPSDLLDFLKQTSDLISSNIDINTAETQED